MNANPFEYNERRIDAAIERLDKKSKAPVQIGLVDSLKVNLKKSFWSEENLGFWLVTLFFIFVFPGPIGFLAGIASSMVEKSGIEVRENALREEERIREQERQKVRQGL
jgi:hypothetical protein